LSGVCSAWAAATSGQGSTAKATHHHVSPVQQRDVSNLSNDSADGVEVDRAQELGREGHIANRKVPNLPQALCTATSNSSTAECSLLHSPYASWICTHVDL
jgi:hypothetical protein